MSNVSPTLLIACGALAAEADAVLKQGGLDHVKLTCLPAKLHNTPQKIPELLRAKIREHRDAFETILVLYGDCGTAGGIDAVLQEEGASRITGAHCYEFYAGSREFEILSDEEPGSFYLTDFLVRHFDRLVWEGLGLDRQRRSSRRCGVRGSGARDVGSRAGAAGDSGRKPSLVGYHSFRRLTL